MKITDIRLGMISVPLHVPFKTAVRSVNAVEDIIVEFHTDTGHVGYGEAPPTALVTGETKESIIAAFQHHIKPTLMGREVDDLEDLMKDLDSCMEKNTSAKAAADMALYDLYGQLYQIPVYKLLGGSRNQLETDITISVNEPEEMARDARKAIERGYGILKVKVGVNPALDVERLKAIREVAGAEVKLRIDANQAWKPKEAVRLLDRMQEENLNIELCEQPVIARDIKGLKYVTDHGIVPIMADECLYSPFDALKLIELGAADILNIKLMKCGGIHNGLKIATLAEVAGVECMIGCMLEAKISVNAAVHLACAKSVIARVDLDGPVLCREDPIIGGARFEEQTITLSDEPGLGIKGIDSICYLD